MTTCYILFVSLIIVTIIDIIIENDLRKKMKNYEKSALQYKKENDARFDNVQEGFNRIKEELITISSANSKDVDRLTDIVNELINKSNELEKKVEEFSKPNEKKTVSKKKNKKEKLEEK